MLFIVNLLQVLSAICFFTKHQSSPEFCQRIIPLILHTCVMEETVLQPKKNSAELFINRSVCQVLLCSYKKDSLINQGILVDSFSAGGSP